MSASTSARPSYAAVLRIPHVRRTFAAALVGRLSYGMVSLAVLLSVSQATGSYAVAGTVMALFGALSVLLSPLRASLVDRYGPRRVLPPLAFGYAGLLTALAVATWRPGADALLVGAVAVAAGAFPPPLGPTMRAVWSELVEDPRLIQRAFGLDGVAEELLFVSGPLLVGAVVRWAPPSAAVALGALLVAAGTLLFVSSPGTARLHYRRDPQPRKAGGRRRASRGLAQPVLVAAATGLATGAFDLMAVAFVEQRHYGTSVVTWVFAALSGGSAVGGLVYGAVRWRSTARLRLALLAVGLGLTLAAAGLVPGIASFAVAAACAGLFIAPSLTTAYLVADEAAGPGFRTRAGAWVNTAVNAGGSAGSAVAGALVGRLPLTVCFMVSGAAAVVAGMMAMVRPRDTQVVRAGADTDAAATHGAS
ncbi:MFS transporter [Streptomyces sp. NPDC003674]